MFLLLPEFVFVANWAALPSLQPHCRVGVCGVRVCASIEGMSLLYVNDENPLFNGLSLLWCFETLVRHKGLIVTDWVYQVFFFFFSFVWKQEKEFSKVFFITLATKLQGLVCVLWMLVWAITVMFSKVNCFHFICIVYMWSIQ